MMGAQEETEDAVKEKNGSYGPSVCCQMPEVYVPAWLSSCVTLTCTLRTSEAHYLVYQLGIGLLGEVTAMM